MKNKLKSIWNWLNGKKTIIAAIYWLVIMPLLTILYPAGLPIMLLKITTMIGAGLSLIGLSHKFIKNKYGVN